MAGVETLLDIALCIGDHGGADDIRREMALVQAVDDIVLVPNVQCAEVGRVDRGQLRSTDLASVADVVREFRGFRPVWAE